VGYVERLRRQKRLRLSQDVDACCGFCKQKRLRLSLKVDECKPLPLVLPVGEHHHPRRLRRALVHASHRGVGTG